MSKLICSLLILLFSAGLCLEKANAISFKSSSKTCTVYSGEENVVWRDWTINPGDVFDLAEFPEEVRLDAYSELYMGLLQEGHISLVECSD